ncbi:hypothetical protein V7128_02120 [Neobacillus vireti]
MEKEKQFYKYFKALLNNKTLSNLNESDKYKIIGELSEKFMIELEKGVIK